MEDIVQDAFASAIISWEKDGMPTNPAGWIYRVCRNKALNKIQQEKRMRIVSKFEEEDNGLPILSEFVLEDQQLRLLFACAHPDLSPKVQVVITLKYVANLKVQAIAKALGMTEDGIDKLLQRARQKIKDDKILLKEPLFFQLKSRLPIVHKIIYLIYNEGYRPGSGEDV
ncbi:MAG: RNA polymerase subunit sigma-24, partial [Bacteroidetes bacterium]